MKEDHDKLKKERLDIIQKISDVKLEIGKLESKEKMYEGMLSRDNKLKEQIESEAYNLTEDGKQLYATEPKV
ncbi:hypothetical protein [Mulberry dwarf phytoplasma]|uniref:hypothetical protein n=1 Tax=Mulberry dwarf phytoplasma TaxID=186171 RepID=UPI001D10ABCF|nr:hypothetical protein [Mulberry dwarf phytoplasma]